MVELLLKSSGLEWFDQISDKALSEFRYVEIIEHNFHFRCSCSLYATELIYAVKFIRNSSDLDCNRNLIHYHAEKKITFV